MWKKTSLTFFIEIVIICIGLINSIIINRALGPSGKGIYAYMLLIVSMSVMLLESGIFTGLSYKYSKNNENMWKTFSFLYTIFWLLISLFIYFANILARFNIYHMVVFAFFFTLNSKILTAFFLGKGKIKLYNLLRFFPILIQFFLLVFSLLLHKHLTPLFVFNIYTLSFGIYFFILIFFNIPSKIMFPNLQKVIEMWKYSFKIYVSNLSSYLNYRADMLLIALILAPEYVGWYSVAVFIIEKAKLFSSSMSIVNFSLKISNKYRGDRFQNFRISNTANLVIALLIIVFSKFFINLLYGENFLPSYIPAIILAPGILFVGFGKLLSSELSAEGIVNPQMFSSLFAMILNILLNIIFIPKFGIKGAALVSVFSYFLNMIIILLFFKKYYNVKFRDLTLMTKNDYKMITKVVVEKLLKKSN